MSPTANRMTIYIVGSIVIGLAFNYFYGGPAPAGVVVKKPSSHSSSSQNGQTLYTKEDETAHFGPLARPIKNAFLPLVTDATRSTMNVGKTGGFGIPSQFAGGSTSWAFTGTAELNGQTYGVLEDTVLGDGDFVKVGQTWKSSEVVAISSSTITLRNIVTGESQSIMDESDAMEIADAAKANTQASAPLPGQIPPVMPPISGPIGGGLSIQPVPGNPTAQAAPGAVTAQADAVPPTAPQQNQKRQNFRRGNRFGRGVNTGN